MLVRDELQHGKGLRIFETVSSKLLFDVSLDISMA